jgi:hypothetical protein
MHLHHGVPMLAAVATLAGACAPAANAFENRTPAPGAVPASVRAQSRSSGLSEQGAIELGAAVGVALVVVGGGLSLTRGRPQQPQGTRRTATGA